MAELKLQDFEIQGPAEVGTCGNTGSFRACHRRDGKPVLLHKFRPADNLLKHNPIIPTEEGIKRTTEWMKYYYRIK